MPAETAPHGARSWLGRPSTSPQCILLATPLEPRARRLRGDRPHDRALRARDLVVAARATPKPRPIECGIDGRHRRARRSTTPGFATPDRSSCGHPTAPRGSLHFRFNAWGEKRSPDATPRSARVAAAVPRSPVSTRRRWCSRAGSIAVDGAGHAGDDRALSAQPEPQPRRTAGADIERTLKCVLGVERIVWLADAHRRRRRHRRPCRQRRRLHRARGAALVQGCDDPDNPNHGDRDRQRHAARVRPGIDVIEVPVLPYADVREQSPHAGPLRQPLRTERSRSWFPTSGRCRRRGRVPDHRRRNIPAGRSCRYPVRCSRTVAAACTASPSRSPHDGRATSCTVYDVLRVAGADAAADRANRCGSVSCRSVGTRMPNEHHDLLASAVAVRRAHEGAQLVCLQELTLSPYFAISGRGPAAAGNRTRGATGRTDLRLRGRVAPRRRASSCTRRSTSGRSRTRR